MRRVPTTLLATAVVALGLALGGCGADGPAYVLVTFERGDAPPETAHIDLQASFNGQTATVPVDNGDGSPIDFPKTKSLEIDSGTGALQLTAIGRDASGADLVHGSATATVVRGAVTNVTITFAKRNGVTVLAQNRGVGSGVVTVSPGGMTCSNMTCDYDFAPGTTVSLVAMPGANTRFAGWTGDCTGTGSCDLTIDGLKSVGAVFAAYELDLSVTGMGAVDLSNPTTSCTGQCAPVYSGDGETVTLTPRPGSGQAFGGWTGDCNGYGPCTLLMDQNHTAGASFGTARTLTVVKAGGGQGTVTSADGVIDCGATCANDYVDGTMVTLTATPEMGHVFSGFTPPSACVTMTPGSCTLTMDAAKTVTATFVVHGIDLTVKAMTCTPTAFQDTSPISCSITVANIGDTDAPSTNLDLIESQNSQFSPNDFRMTSCGVPAITAGGTQTVTCNGNWSKSGQYAAFGPAYVLANVDPQQTVFEASYANNLGTASVKVSTLGIELVPIDFSCIPLAANPGRDVSCTVTIFNAGNQVAGGGTFQPTATSSLFLTTNATATTGTNIGSCTPISSANPIAPQASATFSCTGTIPAAQAAGTQLYLGVAVDDNRAFPERSFSNNAMLLPFVVTVPGGVQLVAQKLSCPGKAAPGDAVVCSVTAINLGELTAPPFPVELRLSDDTVIDGTDTLLGTCMVGSSLRAGQGTVLSCSGMVPSSTPTSTKRLGIILDPANITNDVNRADNTLSSPLVIGPDISVVSMSCPASAARNGSISCTVTLANNGSQPSGAFSNVLHYAPSGTVTAGDPTIGLACNALAMAPNTTQSITCSGTVPSTAPVGYGVFWVQADSTNAVTEANEANNTRSSSIGLGPNLVLSGYSCTPNPVTHGASITCSGTMTNNGAEAAGSFANQLYLTTNGVYPSGATLLANCPATGALAAGATAAFSCTGVVPSTTAAGGYYFGVLVDSGGAVTEFNENDNSYSYTYITVQ